MKFKMGNFHAADILATGRPTRQPGGGKRRMVVGLDFGTTYSGVAYCVLPSSSSPGDIRDISVINTWPSIVPQHEEKVPTEICYDPPSVDNADGSSHVLWGYNATSQFQYHSKRSAKIRPIYGRFKLLLDPDTGETRHNAAHRGKGIDAGNKYAVIDVPEGKSALDLTAEYLSEIYKHVMKILRTKLYSTEEFDNTEIEFIATVPAIWRHRAQAATRDAFERAGFGVKRGKVKDSLKLVSEPEAAALYTLKEKYPDKAKNPLKEGDQLMVIDAGGGTVDVITYEVVSAWPSLKLAESVVGSGGRCGSSFIDDRLHGILREKLGPSYDDETVWPTRYKGRGSPLATSLDQIKRNFQGLPTERPRFIQLPVQVPNNEKNGIVDNEMPITSQEVARCFEPVIRDIIRLLDRQRQDLLKLGKADRLKTAILVGGFGNSAYLRQRIEKWGKCFPQVIDILSPNNPWSAVARGAVLYGINPVVRSRKLRTHYGIKVAVPFDRRKNHDEKRSYIDHFGGKRFLDGAQWLASIGQDVTEETKIIFPVGFVRSEDEILDRCEVQIKGCKFAAPPDDIEDYRVDHLATLHIPVLDIPVKEMQRVRDKEGNYHYLCKVNIEMRLKSAEAIFNVAYKRKRCGPNIRVSHQL